MMNKLIFRMILTLGLSAAILANYLLWSAALGRETHVKTTLAHYGMVIQKGVNDRLGSLMSKNDVNEVQVHKRDNAKDRKIVSAIE